MSLLFVTLTLLQAHLVLSQFNTTANITISTNNTNSVNKVTNKTVSNNQVEFKPSPQDFFERNVVPVIPAYPEAKTFNSWKNSNPETPNSQRTVTFPRDSPYGFDFNKKVEVKQKTYYDYNMLEKPPHHYQDDVYNPTGYGTHYEVQSYPVKEHGYPVNEHSYPVKEHGYPVNEHNYPVKEHGYPVNEHSYPVKEHGYPVNEHSYPAKDHSYPVKEHSYGVDNYNHDKSPWKKILKFLAAIIPIGLFLSALTPTVITIQNTNDSLMTNYRSEDFSKRLSSSFKYIEKINNEDACEDKVLCELLLNASLSKNAEEHITTFLDNFLKQEDLQSKKGELLKVFDAVKNQDCSSIICNKIPK